MIWFIFLLVESYQLAFLVRLALKSKNVLDML